MKKFEWLPTECASKNHPMVIVQGDLYFPVGSSIYLPDDRLVSNGRADMGSLNDQLNDRMPKHFDVRWLNEAGELHFGKADLDEQELYDASRHFSNTSKSSPLQFIVTFDRMAGTLKVAISNGEEIYEFKRANLKVTRSARRGKKVIA